MPNLHLLPSATDDRLVRDCVADARLAARLAELGDAPASADVLAALRQAGETSLWLRRDRAVSALAIVLGGLAMGRYELCEVCHKADRSVCQWLGHVDYSDGPLLCDMCAGQCAKVAVETYCEDRTSKRNGDLYDAAFTTEAKRLADELDGDACRDCGGDCKGPCRPEPDGCETAHLRSPLAGPP
jgi:hypothetical protein